MINSTADGPPRVVVIGDIITDVLAIHDGPIAPGSDTASTISITGGGSAANTAAWLASVGIPASLVGVVGADVAGTDRLAELAASDVDCSRVRRAPSAPTGSIIVLSHAAERSFLCDRGANHLLAPSDVDRAVTGATHLHLSGYTLLDGSSRPAGIHALAMTDLTRSVDAASAAPLQRLGGEVFLSWVRGVDLLFANLDEARTLLGDPTAAPARLARALAGVTTHAIVKLGADGAVWAGPAGEAWMPAEPAASLVDPTGAGDAFAAGFLSAWLRGASPTQALRVGARLGAAAVGIVGGRPRASAGSPGP